MVKSFGSNIPFQFKNRCKPDNPWLVARPLCRQVNGVGNDPVFNFMHELSIMEEAVRQAVESARSAGAHRVVRLDPMTGFPRVESVEPR